MGLAKLSRVTVIAPRSEYSEVAKRVAQFEDFHPLDQGAPNFDPVLQELTVKAVRLFAQADQTVKDLDLELMPGTIDIVFRGVKIPRNQFEASTWEELLNRADTDLHPIAEEVKRQRDLLQKAVKAETDAQTAMSALQAVSGFSGDVGRIQTLQRLKVEVYVVPLGTVEELRNSLPDSIFLARNLSETHALVLVAVQRSDEAKLDKAVKALEVKALQIPSGIPQVPAEAYKHLTSDLERAQKDKGDIEAKLVEIKERSHSTLLAIRELTEVARELLDQARVSGGLGRMAVISGYIPKRREAQFREMFGTPGTVKCASVTLSVESTSFVVMSKPQARWTYCSPRLNTLVWVQPIGLGAAPAGRVPLTLSA